MKKANVPAQKPQKEKSNFERVVELIEATPESEQNLFIEEIIKYFALKRHSEYTAARENYDIKSKLLDGIAGNYKIAAEVIELSTKNSR